jgi:3-hydroxyisobutyrate dehydrogenase-like beta-hydroxyacid dehydrogenase
VFHVTLCEVYTDIVHDAVNPWRGRDGARRLIAWKNLEGSAMKVSVVGLGKMGTGIATRILQAGHPLRVWNRTPQKMLPLISAGAVAATSSQDAARGADIVLTSLMDDQSIVDAVEGQNGFVQALSPGAIHLCVTTISPDCADKLGILHSAHGSRFVSGPVAGRPESAERGDLITFLAGEASAIEDASVVCDAYARRVFKMPGMPGLANSLKLCVNYTAVSIIELMGEIYAFGDKAGLDSDVIKELFLELFASPALKTYAAKIKSGQFSNEVGFTLKGGLKDVRLMLAASAKAGVAFDIAQLVERKMVNALDRGMGDDDWSTFTKITRQESGLI